MSFLLIMVSIPMSCDSDMKPVFSTRAMVRFTPNFLACRQVSTLVSLELVTAMKASAS